MMQQSIIDLMSGMFKLLLLNWGLNDLPHAAGLLSPVPNPGSTDIGTYVSAETMDMLRHEALLYDDRFIALRDYLQEYANLADRGLDYPDYKVEELFNQSWGLAAHASTVLYSRVSYFMYMESYTEDDFTRAEPGPEKEELRREWEKAKGNYREANHLLRRAERAHQAFYDARTRFDKVSAIDTFVSICHLSGRLLNELFEFPPFHEPTQRYVNEILDRLAG